MDNLTHGLLGLAVGALRVPRSRNERDGGRLGPTDKAVLLGCVLAAEIPDLDTLWPSEPVLQALQAHRGISHALVAAPVVALLASLLALLVFRKARWLPVWLWSLAAIPVAHLLPDLWTGWGTRLLLPFSDERLALDWTMVVDPLVTLPLIIGAVWAFRRKRLLPLRVALAVTVLYVGGRGMAQSHLTSRVAALHPAAETVAVFPSWLGPFHWRWVAAEPGEYVAGSVGVFGAVEEHSRIPRVPVVLPAAWTGHEAVAEAVAWARFPSTEIRSLPDGTSELWIADLRYHLHGHPTLAFVFELGEEGAIRSARLERGGSAGDLWDRFRAGPEKAEHADENL